jgi:hypothetical protein
MAGLSGLARAPAFVVRVVAKPNPRPSSEGCLPSGCPQTQAQEYRSEHSRGPRAWRRGHGKRRVNAELALRLARFFGTDARSWVNLQAHNDLERAEIELAARVKKEVGGKRNSRSAT